MAWPHSWKPKHSSRGAHSVWWLRQQSYLSVCRCLLKSWFGFPIYFICSVLGKFRQLGQGVSLWLLLQRLHADAASLSQAAAKLLSCRGIGQHSLRAVLMRTKYRYTLYTDFCCYSLYICRGWLRLFLMPSLQKGLLLACTYIFWNTSTLNIKVFEELRCSVPAFHS